MLDPSKVFRPLLRLAPASAHAHAVAFVVNRLLRGQTIETRLTELAGKRFCLHVDDVPLALTFEITTRGLQQMKCRESWRNGTRPPSVIF